MWQAKVVNMLCTHSILEFTPPVTEQKFFVTLRPLQVWLPNTYFIKCYFNRFASISDPESELQMWLNEKNTYNVILNTT